VGKSEELQKIEYAKSRRSLRYWLETYAWTIDEHSETGEAFLRRFPMQEGCPERDYLSSLIDIWIKEYRLLVEKSRKMLMTWFFVAAHLWLAQFNQGRLIFFQSEQEKGANSNILRAKFIYDHQPFWLRIYPITHKDCHLQWPTRYSEIWAIAQGPNIIRQYTASAIFSDEMAFQKEAEEAYIASKPTIDGGGRFTGVSTAYPGFFEEMCRDRV